jgi:hypothetical protein
MRENGSASASTNEPDWRMHAAPKPRINVTYNGEAEVTSHRKADSHPPSLAHAISVQKDPKKWEKRENIQIMIFSRGQERVTGLRMKTAKIAKRASAR